MQPLGGSRRSINDATLCGLGGKFGDIRMRASAAWMMTALRWDAFSGGVFESTPVTLYVRVGLKILLLRKTGLM